MDQRFFICVVIFFIFPAHLYGQDTKQDCKSHNTICENKCYDEYHNVKYKSQTTKEYLKRCILICRKRHESCLTRVNRRRSDRAVNIDPYDLSIYDHLSGTGDKTPNKIYKYRDKDGHYHVVDDIKKIPPEYRGNIGDGY